MNSSSIQRKKKLMKRIILEGIVVTAIIVSTILLCIILKKSSMHRLTKVTEFKPDTTLFNIWLDPPISTTRSYYLFNITNPLDIVRDPKDTTIKFQDTPPYTYNMKTSKTNVQWLENNRKLSYAVEQLFTRDPKRFNLSLVNDTGVFVDLLRATLRSQFGAKPTPAFYMLGGKNPFSRRNAVEQIEGFTSDLFKSMQHKMTGPNTGKFGIVYQQNGSRLYNISISTGKKIV